MKKLLTILCTGFILSGCMGSTIGQVKGWFPGGFDESQPIITQLDKEYKPGLLAIGPLKDQLQQQSLGLGLVSYPELEAFLNTRLETLKQVSGIEGLEGRVYVVANTVFGASCSADGNIYIPMGTIQDIDSEDMLVALLAHELSHNILNHPDSDLFVQIQKKGVLASALIANLNKDETDAISSRDKRRMENALGMMLVSDGFINPGWTRGQESEADRLGLDLIVAAGYNPDGMFNLFEKMKAGDERNRTFQEAERQQQIKNLKQYKSGAGDQIDAGLNTLTASLQSNLMSLLDDTSKNHDDTEKRITELVEYVDLHYPELEEPQTRKRAWNRIVRTARYKALQRSLKLAMTAHNQMSAREISKAARTIAGAVNSHTRNQNFIRQVFYEVREEQNRKDSMRANLKYGLQGKYPSFKLYVNQARLKATKSGLSEQQLDTLVQQFDRFGRPPHFYKDVIALADLSENSVISNSLKTECNLKYAGDGIQCGGDQEAASLGFDQFRKALGI